MAHVYVITNTINGKQYVGATRRSVEKRFKEHYFESKRQRCKNRPLYIAINKYGIDNFSIEELEECLDEERFDRECYWIEKLKTYDNGYNLTYGGAGKNLFDYKEIADKYLEIKNQKEVAKLFNCDIHTVRVACKDNDIDIISKHDVQKNLYAKKIAMVDKDSDVVVRVFNCMEDAFRFLDASRNGHISAVCKGNRKTAFGYKWRYVDDEYISNEFENKAI